MGFEQAYVYPGGGNDDGFPTSWVTPSVSVARLAELNAPAEAVVALTWAQAASANPAQMQAVLRALWALQTQPEYKHMSAVTRTQVSGGAG
jgi:hypothetical protein